MIAVAGNFFISAALLSSLYSFAVSLAAERSGRQGFKLSAAFSFHIGSAMLLLASAVLLTAFMRDYFVMEYVFAYSSTNMPFAYKLAAFYAGREGSLLLWALILSLSSSIFISGHAVRMSQESNRVLAVLSAVTLFFNALIYMTGSPFKTLSFVPAQGSGLNPLLENIFMTVHPPSLYLGFVLFTVPFAYALVDLYDRRFDGRWIRTTKPWIIAAWLFLGLGNVLGSYWAYIELGWGGYWAWDPVENASLIPWLISTGLLHSLIAEKRTGMFKVWNLVLIFLTFISTIVATFLTRSGIVESVHAFSGSSVGNYFLVFIVVVSCASLGMLVFRLGDVPKSGGLDNYSSKESAFWLLNVIFTFSGIAVLIGTLLPVISEFLLNRKLALEASYYNRVFSVLGLVFLFLLGLCPLLSWRRGFKGFLSFPFAGYVTAVSLGFVTAVILKAQGVKTVLSYSLALGAAFTALNMLFKDFRRGVSDTAQKPLRWVKISRYGGILAHLGVIMMFTGITGAAHREELERYTKKGDEFVFMGLRIEDKGFSFSGDGRKEMIFSLFDIYEGERLKAKAAPAKYFYIPTLGGTDPNVTTEMGVYRTFMGDMLFILLGYDIDEGVSNIKMIYKPLIAWLWLGSALLFAATVIVLAAVFKEGEKSLR